MKLKEIAGAVAKRVGLPRKLFEIALFEGPHGSLVSHRMNEELTEKESKVLVDYFVRAWKHGSTPTPKEIEDIDLRLNKKDAAKN